jgi:hypothetical protein
MKFNKQHYKLNRNSNVVKKSGDNDEVIINQAESDFFVNTQSNGNVQKLIDFSRKFQSTYDDVDQIDDVDYNE